MPNLKQQLHLIIPIQIVHLQLLLVLLLKWLQKYISFTIVKFYEVCIHVPPEGYGSALLV